MTVAPFPTEAALRERAVELAANDIHANFEGSKIEVIKRIAEHHIRRLDFNCKKAKGNLMSVEMKFLRRRSDE